MGEKLTRTQIKNLERFGGVNPADETFSRRQFATQVGGYALLAGGAVAGGLWLRDRWGMEGVKPPPPVRLKDYSIKLPVSRPNMIIVRSSPVLPEKYTSKDDEMKAREEQEFSLVKAAMDAMGGVSLFIQQGDATSSSSLTSRSTRTPTWPPPPNLIRSWQSPGFAWAPAHARSSSPITRSTTPKAAFTRPRSARLPFYAGAELMMPKDSYF